MLGHVATLPLVPAVVDAVDPVPVVAAGGVGDGRGVAAVLALGAAAAWLGTAFLLADEADVHRDYQAAVASAEETDTAHSVLYDGGWPDAPHRTLATAEVRAWEAAGRPATGGRAGEGDVVAHEGSRPILRYAADVPTSGIEGDIGALAHYAGQSAGLVRATASAAAIVERISREAAATLAVHRPPLIHHHRLFGPPDWPTVATNPPADMSTSTVITRMIRLGGLGRAGALVRWWLATP